MISVLIGGIERAGALRLEDGLQSVTSAADGSMSDSGLKVDDPNGAFVILPWMTVVIEESDCPQPRSFTGYVYSAQISRGPYLTGAGRVWVLEIIDLNGLLKLRAFHAANAKRPEETVAARMTWLLASVAMSGLVYDNGLIGAVSPTFTVGPRDYRQDGYALDVLADCVVVQRVFFVYWDASAPAGQEASLFFYGADDAVKDSTLRISNVLADIDGTTTFFGYISPDLTTAGEEIYDGLVWNDPDRLIYRQLASTFTTYGIHRDGRVNTDRVRSASRASELVDQWLVKHSVPMDTIAVTIRLPPSKVNLLEAGDRVQVKFSHLPGFTSFTWTRVTRRTFIFTPGTNEYYDVQLELSVRGLDIIGGGGGNPGELPHAPAAEPGLIQAKGDQSGLVVMDTIPVDGDLLMCWQTARPLSQTPNAPAGFTSIRTVELSGDYHTARLSYRIASGESGTYVGTGAQIGVQIHISEWTGATLGASVQLDDQGPSFAVTAGGALTPAAANAILVGNGLYGGFAAVGVTPGVGVTELYDRDNPGGNSPTCWVGYKTVPSPVSTVVDGAMNISEKWAGVTYELLPFAGANPPPTGTWVGISPPEVVVMSGVNGTTEFPFADGSLRVFYDIVEQTSAIVSQNGAAGTFVMPSAPPPSTQVFVQYQGI